MDTLQPGALVGDYRVEKELGEGGCATVYSAKHVVVGKEVALKVIGAHLVGSTFAAERFIEEARTVNRIAHPNIVDIVSCGTLEDGRPYLVMELLKGRTLDDLLGDRRLGLAESLEILLPICDALMATHAAGVIHRDIKPENVFLVEDNDRRLVKLLDFGIAKLLRDRSAPRGKRTRSDVVVGTPEYLAPEQARGQPVDARTDVYSLGVLAYEMLVGRRPYVASFPIDILQAHLHETPPRPRALRPELPVGVETLLLWMLEKQPNHRPVMAQVRDCLREVRELGGEMSASPPSLTERLPKRPARRRAWLALPALLVVALAATGWTIRGATAPWAPPAGVLWSEDPELQMSVYYENNATLPPEWLPAVAELPRCVVARAPHRRDLDYLLDLDGARE